jgi:outer membrane lipoprotein carrier protein
VRSSITARRGYSERRTPFLTYSDLVQTDARFVLRYTGGMDVRKYCGGLTGVCLAVLELAIGVCVLSSSGLAASAAQKPSDTEPIRLMERRYKAAKTLQATFLERYTENDRTVRVESGVAYFRRPGKMRWEYAAPENNLFLIDGKMAWFYVPADRTVTRVPAKQSTDWRTPLALLAGETKVSRVCARIELVSDQQPEKPGDAVFSCILRGSADSKARSANKNADAGDAAKLTSHAPQNSDQEDTVLLEIGRESGELVRIVVRNKGGVGIEFHFANWLDNPPIAEALFHFEPPKGVAIVNAELPPETSNSE